MGNQSSADDLRRLNARADELSRQFAEFLKEHQSKHPGAADRGKAFEAWVMQQFASLEQLIEISDRAKVFEGLAMQQTAAMEQIVLELGARVTALESRRRYED